MHRSPSETGSLAETMWTSYLWKIPCWSEAAAQPTAGTPQYGSDSQLHSTAGTPAWAAHAQGPPVPTQIALLFYTYISDGTLCCSFIINWSNWSGLAKKKKKALSSGWAKRLGLPQEMYMMFRVTRLHFSAKYHFNRHVSTGASPNCAFLSFILFFFFTRQDWMGYII